MSGASPNVLVLCLGNPDRGDDAIGPAVAKRLEGRLPPGAVLSARSGDMLALIDDWQGYDALICVDAAAPSAGPGTVHRVDLGVEDLPRDVAVVSSHAFGLGEAVTLARTLGLAPPEIVVYAVEGATFEPGAPISPQAAGAIPLVAERVAAEAARILEAASHA